MSYNKFFKKSYIFIGVPLVVLMIFTGYMINSYKNSFNSSEFHADNVYRHIEELSSSKYKGRLAGSAENKEALKYIEDYFKKIGVEPGGEEGTYYQSFRTIVPQIDSNPIFTIEDNGGNIIDSFAIYEDYKIYTYGYGGGIDFNGDIVFVDSYLHNVDPLIIKDNIVVTTFKAFTEKDVEYILDNGGKGLFFYQEPSWGQRDVKSYEMKSTSFSFKRGRTLGFGPISKDVYVKLKQYAKENPYDDEGVRAKGAVIGKIHGVRVKGNIGYPVLETSNILGKIEGEDKKAGYLIISGHMDHVGEGGNGKFFPGALDNASGTAMMLELARTIKAQGQTPKKTINFVGWNSEENGIQGSKHYVNNPIYPLEQTQVLAIDCIGAKDSNEIIIESSGDKGNILKSIIYQYGIDLGIKVKEVRGNSGSDHAPFIYENIPAVMIADGYTNIHKYDDTIENIDINNLDKVGGMLINYIKHDIYGDEIPDYLNRVEVSMVSFIILGLFFIYIIYMLNKITPNIKIIGLTIEDIYYSISFNILSKFFYYAMPIVVILFSLLFIANLPQNFNLIIDKGRINTNFSLYLTVKNSVLYIRQLLTEGLGTSARSNDVLGIIINTSTKSGILMVFTIVFSVFFGIIKGFFDGYRKNKGELRTITTLVALSLPDVLIALFAMLGIIMIANNEALSEFVSPKNLRVFVMPLLTLTILPSVYISRITFITIQEEMKNGYVNAAKAKGLSRFKIFTNHILKAVIIKVVESLSSILTIVISNLIIVEFLFGYPGIIYSLLQYYKQEDTITFIGLALSLGLMYVVFNLLFKLIGKLINPLKGEGVN